ncbi:hypothetical protein FAVG1_12836 [Fusarium avenaceum]|nr:hypothetical protein FAVG1_12836 [Fusarium avenaceum]
MAMSDQIAAFDLISKGTIQDLTPAEANVIRTAVRAIERDLAKEDQGLTNIQLPVLLFYTDNSDDRDGLLVRYATTIIDRRFSDCFTDEDKQLIEKAYSAVESRMAVDGRAMKDATTTEKKIITANLKLNSSDTETQLSQTTTRPSPQPSASTTDTASLISSLNRVAGLPDRVSEMNAEQRDRAHNFMRRHPRYFDMPGFPDLPSYEELRMEDLPNTVADLDAEIDARIQHQAAAQQFLIRNNGLLWMLKRKRNELRDE